MWSLTSCGPDSRLRDMTNDISTIQPTTIRKAGLADLSGASIALAAAFQDDPVFGYCIPDRQRRRRCSRRSSG